MDLSLPPPLQHKDSHNVNRIQGDGMAKDKRHDWSTGAKMFFVQEDMFKALGKFKMFQPAVKWLRQQMEKSDGQITTAMAAYKPSATKSLMVVHVCIGPKSPGDLGLRVSELFSGVVQYMPGRVDP